MGPHAIHAEAEDRLRHAEDRHARTVGAERVGGAQHFQREPVVAQHELGELLRRHRLVAQHPQRFRDLVGERREIGFRRDLLDAGRHPLVARVLGHAPNSSLASVALSD
jgi:hypothetical protein